MVATDGQLIDPHFLRQNNNGENYKHFLYVHLPEIIIRIFKHDGCHAHYLVNVRHYLRKIIEDGLEEGEQLRGQHRITFRLF